jgi:hypothetical protein
MDRKREAAKQRKKNLEEQHASAIDRKEQNDMEAAEKNREAGEVEAQVSLLPSFYPALQNKTVH